MIISTGVEKAFNKIKHSFAIKKKKTLNNLITEGNFINLIKSMYIPTANIILMAKD